MTIEIDPLAGFCSGVHKAIQMAENELQEDQPLYCLGDIVHNENETGRLESSGLKTIDHKDLPELVHQKVFIRAHGEAPSTYETAEKLGITLVDATCPVVKKLQERVKHMYHSLKACNGTLVIFGKKEHPEVKGLAGQVNDDLLVVREIADLGTLDFSHPIGLVSQTTMNPDAYEKIRQEIIHRMKQHDTNPDLNLEVVNSICGQVTKRKPRLKEFIEKHEVVIFVSGKKSSNGKTLYEYCQKINPSTYLVNDLSDVRKEWFAGISSAGISGAASTPRWLMEEVAREIKELLMA